MPSYKELIVQDMPVAAWMLDSNTSVENDVTISGLNANIAVSDRIGLPVVGGAKRALTFNSPGDTVFYPNLNIWSQGNHGTSFSVEFVVRPIFSLERINIFTPINSSGQVQENGIFIHNNKLSFVVSDWFSGSYSEKAEAYTFFDFSGATYHCVAVYSPGQISLYVNGEMVSNVPLANKFGWRHQSGTTDSFMTTGAATASAMISGIAVYKRPLEFATIMNHYRSVFYRPSPHTVSAREDCAVFRLNDTDRQKGFYFNSPLTNEWQQGLMDNVSIKNNKISLDTIEPIVLSSGSATFSSSKLSLSTSQYLTLKNAERFFASSGTSVGFNIRYTAARHGTLSSGEYCALSIFNREKLYAIEVVEKSDKDLYLRYTSRDTVVEQLLASPATGSDSDNYLLVQFNNSEISAAWNDNSSVAVIDLTLDDALAPPDFSDGVTLNIGADTEETGFWGAPVWWLNIWASSKAVDSIPTIKEDVYQYTAKLSNDLNISQRGSISWIIDTGSAAAEGETINQSRIWWAPSIPKESLRIQAGVTTYLDMPIVIQGPSSSQVGYESGYTTGYGGIIGQSVYEDIYEDFYSDADVGLTLRDNMFEVPEINRGDYIPETMFLSATLTTDDSVNNVVFLKKIGIDLLTNSDVVAEAGQTDVVFGSEPNIEFSTENISSQELYIGASVTSVDSAFQIYSPFTTDPVTDNTDIPESATVALATKMDMAKSLEFFLRIPTDTGGILFKYKGSENHTLSYDYGTRKFSIQGFDKLYIDGVETILTAGATPAMPTFFENKWHMISLVKSNLIANSTEYTLEADTYFDYYSDNYGTTQVQTFSSLYNVVSGSPVVALDPKKFYYDNKSFKIAAAGSAGVVEFATLDSGPNIANGAKNTVAFFVYPDAGVTSVVTNFRYNSTNSKVTHTVTPETWNLVTRTFTNPAPLTDFSLRIETASGSQTVWIDSPALCKGSDAYIRFASTSSGSSWFGKDVDNPSTNQLIFDIQNPIVQYKSQTPFKVAENLRYYIGEASSTLTSSGSSMNLSPQTGAMVSEPETVINRNPGETETLFETNPAFLSNEWQILSVN